MNFGSGVVTDICSAWLASYRYDPVLSYLPSLRGAITYNLEKACDDCGVWPRRKDQLRCSGNVCRYPRS